MRGGCTIAVFTAGQLNQTHLRGAILSVDTRTSDDRDPCRMQSSGRMRTNVTRIPAARHLLYPRSIVARRPSSRPEFIGRVYRLTFDGPSGPAAHDQAKHASVGAGVSAGGRTEWVVDGEAVHAARTASADIPLIHPSRRQQRPGAEVTAVDREPHGVGRRGDGGACASSDERETARRRTTTTSTAHVVPTSNGSSHAVLGLDVVPALRNRRRGGRDTEWQRTSERSARGIGHAAHARAACLPGPAAATGPRRYTPVAAASPCSDEGFGNRTCRDHGRAGRRPHRLRVADSRVGHRSRGAVVSTLPLSRPPESDGARPSTGERSVFTACGESRQARAARPTLRCGGAMPRAGPSRCAGLRPPRQARMSPRVVKRSTRSRPSTSIGPGRVT